MFLCGSENQFSEAKVLLLTKVGVRLLNFFSNFGPKILDFWVRYLHGPGIVQNTDLKSIRSLKK